MNPRIRWLLVVAALACWAPAAAAQTPGKGRPTAAAVRTGQSTGKQYRWVDAQGQVHFTDTLPQEAVRRDRTEYRGGRAVRQVDRPLTPEEMAAQRQAEEAQAQARASTLNEAVVRQAYPSEAAIRQDFQQRRALFESRLVSGRAEEEERRQELRKAVTRAADAELLGKPVHARLQHALDALITELKRLRAQNVDTIQALAGLAGEEAEILAQWRTPAQGATRLPAADGIPGG